MNIRQQAEADLAVTLQDGPAGFGWPAIVEDGVNTIGNDVDDPFWCQVGRVHFWIDPDTGVGVDGDFSHVVGRIKDLKAAGFDVDSGSSNWLVTTADIDGTPVSYSVKSMRPDHTLGMLTMICEYVDRSNAANEAIIAAIIAAL